MAIQPTSAKNKFLPSSARILVAGHKGLAGSAITRQLRNAGYEHLILKDRASYDLEDEAQVAALFKAEKPDAVILAAAKVGGILANQNLPYDFIEKNLRIQMNVIGQAHRSGVQSLVFLGSSCVYPKMAPQPIEEESLLTGPLEPTNRPYALAKIAGIELCWALNRQHGRRYFAVMPSNLYGVEDNFDLQSSHVLPALLRKFHVAAQRRAETVEVWGTGNVKREFLLSEDLADGIVHLLTSPPEALDFLFSSERWPLINIGVGEDCSIRELAETIKEVVGFNGEIIFNSKYPDGTPRKLMDVSRMQRLGWKARTSLKSGVEQVYRAVREKLSQ